MGLINSLVQFVAGTKALASEINSNFETLRAGHNDQESRVSAIEGAYVKKDGTVIMTGTLNLGSQKIVALAGGTSSADAVNLGQLGEAVPVGKVIWTAQSTVTAGYLKCNGAAVSRTTYADLFSAIGTTFGAGDGSTTFSLPDLRGEFIRGWDDSRGIDASRAFGSLQADELKSHTHNANYVMQLDSGVGPAAYFARGGGSTATSATGGDETRPRNVALLACIKY